MNILDPIATTVAAALPSSIAPAASTGNVYNDFAVNRTYVEILFVAGGIFLLAALALALPAILKAGRTIPRPRKVIAYVFAGAGIVMVCAASYLQNGASRVSVVFSPRAMLGSVWTTYKDNYVATSTDFRTFDPSRNGETTSEGESYTMLRAAWMDDKQTFDASWKWTQANLQHSGDHLFSWLYGTRPDGTQGVLTDQGGANSASDADSDIALSLMLAYGRWQDPSYLSAAQQIIHDIWADEVVTVAGKPYLAADNVEKNSGSPEIALDPSYFSPYAYRIFAAADPADQWMALLDDSYSVMFASMDSKLDTSTTAEIPPDWVGVNRADGGIVPLADASADSNYGYDAMRLPWRLALDWQWNQDARDKQLLDKMAFLGAQWQQQGLLDAVYAHNGAPVGYYEAPAIYGGDIGYFMVSDPQDAANVYGNKLLILYDPGNADWKIKLGYYDANWAWFGIALYNGLLPNLTTTTPQ